ncbi:MAG: tetratricopeptide repeat protein [Candidatus Obscuribacterales bacterium]|nr:tetratricopeptide repeat protein [Candidatus Obscuribacterales bacterium]
MFEALGKMLLQERELILKPYGGGPERRHLAMAVWNVLLSLALLSPLFQLSPVLAADYQAESQAYKLYAQGYELYRAGSYAQAASSLSQAAAYDPTSFSARIHLSLAQSYQQLKSNKDAIKHAQIAQKLDPNDPYPTYIMALVYNDMKRYDLCLSSLQRYINSPNATARSEAEQMMNTVKVYTCAKDGCEKVNAGKYREAIKLLEIAATADPSQNSGCIHGNLCFAYRKIKNFSRAVSEGQKALSFDPNDASVVYNVAIAYMDMARFDDSISYLQRYLTLESDGSQRANAQQLISELAQDKKKQNSPNNKLPDYLDILKKNDHMYTWSSSRMPIKVYMSKETNTPGYRPVFRNFVMKALDTWCEASGKKINYKITKEKDNADIVVNWTANALDASSELRVVAGLTTFAVLENCFTSTIVQLRTTDAFTPGAFVKDGEMASVTMHEIGHALGLDHSNCISDVMYFRSNGLQNGLPTKRDRLTLAKLYGGHPSTTFVPNPESTPAGPPVVFLPPPTFSPPKLPDNSNIVPPMFTPPPLKEKLPPPMFTPPPLLQNQKSSPNAAAIPTFIPPPLNKKNSGSKKGGEGHGPFFVPPPAR